MPGADQSRRVDPLCAMGGGHPNVGEHDVWLLRLHGVEEAGEIGDSRDDLDVRRGREQGRRTLLDEEVILCEYDSESHVGMVHVRAQAGVSDGG